jgi:hypothetical protein
MESWLPLRARKRPGRLQKKHYDLSTAELLQNTSPGIMKNRVYPPLNPTPVEVGMQKTIATQSTFRPKCETKASPKINIIKRMNSIEMK